MAGYPTITQTLVSKTDTSITVNWSSNQYCKSVSCYINGGQMKQTWEINAKSGTYTMGGLSPNTSYGVLTLVTSVDDYGSVSSPITITTYGAPEISFSVSAKTETSITINYEANHAVDRLQYSTDGASTWSNAIAITSATSGSYTISGLTANTSYSVAIKLRRADCQIYGQSYNQTIKTYDWPHATSLPNFTIGNTLKIGLYNPLGRSVVVTFYCEDNTTKSAGSTTGTSISGFTSSAWKNFIYASIPNAQSGTYKIRCVYSGHTIDTSGGTYTADSRDAAPAIGSLTYADTYTTTTNITQNNQNIVQGLSKVRYTASGLSAKYSATISTVKVKVNGSTYNMTISGSSATGGNAVINSSSSVTAVATITDSRGFTGTASVTVNILSWILPTGIITLRRQSNYYTESYLKVDAQYSSVDSKNSITISYTGSAVPQTGKTTPSSVSGSLSDNVQVTLNLDNDFDWNFTITVTDVFGHTTYNKKLPRGTPIMFWDDLKNSVGVGVFPKYSNGMVIDKLYLTDASKRQVDIKEMIVQRADSIDTISASGWRRIATVNFNSHNQSMGLFPQYVDITVRSQIYSSLGSLHSIRLAVSWNRVSFFDEVSKSNGNGISKIRYTTNGSGTGNIDVYYEGGDSNYLSADFIVRPYLFLWNPVDFVSVNASPSGETVQASYNFSAEYSIYDELYYKSGDSYSALTGISGYMSTNTSTDGGTMSFRFRLPKHITNVTPTLTSLVGRVRHSNGGYVDGITGDWVGATGITVTCSKNDISDEIIITITKASAFVRSSTVTTAVTSNTPVYGTFTATISFT